MTSTRNKNTDLDYNLQQKYNKDILKENLYLHSSTGRPSSECIPSVGYTPSHMSRDALSNNPTDIESTLFGIGSTNLVQKPDVVYPSLRNLDFKDFFDRPNVVIMPYPLIMENNQRPNLGT